MEPAAPLGEIVPSFPCNSLKAGLAPNSPEYPFGPKQAVSPQEFSPNVLNF